MAERISGEASVSRVTRTYAFLKGEQHGTIFVPPAAMGLADAADLTRLLPLNALVTYSAIRQEPKNNCHWRATCVKVLQDVPAPTLHDVGDFQDDHSDLMDSLDIIENVNGVVVKVFPTYCFLHAEALGPVFCPGSAVDPTFTGGFLTNYLQIDDRVTFAAQPQAASQNCHWRAIHCEKINAFTTDPSAQKHDVFEGVITKVMPSFGFIYSQELVGKIYFTGAQYYRHWTDASNARVLDLTTVLQIGDLVKVTPVKQEDKSGCAWRATKVSKLTFDQFDPINKKTSNSTCGRSRLARPPSTQSGFNESDTTESTVSSLSDLSSLPDVGGKLEDEPSTLYRRNPNEKATQTLVRVDELVWGALQRDSQLMEILWARYPALMAFTQVAKY